MVGAHASFTLSEDTLSGCVEAARALRTGIHIHVAEDRADQGDCEARFGKPVVDRLADAGALSEQAVLAHCVHLHPAEIGLVQEVGATVVHNARSNMNNAVGRAPVEAFEDRVALGTDGIDGDLFAESRAAHLRAREDDVFADPTVTIRRLADGARVAGQHFGEPALGKIERGAPADLVVLDYEAPGPVDAGSLAGHWFFGLSARNVRDVIVAGDLVVADRRLTRVDQLKVVADATDVAQRLWQRLEDIEPHPFEPHEVGGR
jgi:cytosine/adenosine deaminase-related metal-dependent hydrolase